MFLHIFKYSKFIALGMVSFYLLGILSQNDEYKSSLLAESFHFFAHIDDMFSGNYHHHQFHNHADKHGHKKLSDLESSLKNHQNNSSSQDDQVNNPPIKFPQLITLPYHFNSLELKSRILPLWANNYFDKFFFEVILPPPRTYLF